MSPALVGARGLPGVALPGRVAGELPRRLLAPGTLLLAGVHPGVPIDLDEHRVRWGPQPRLGLEPLIGAAGRAGLVGAGGAGFPTDRKLASLSRARVSHVIVNGAEGEPASGKDGVLLAHVPHLVLDGAVAAARALGCGRVVVRVSSDRPDLVRSLAHAIARRHEEVSLEVSVGPATFVAGEASAIVRAVSGGPALPADLGRPPVVPGRRAGRRRRALVSNVETFARLAVATRGVLRTSALASASGAVREPGVVELDPDRDLAALARAAGGLQGNPRQLVTGGWHGTWVAWDAAAGETRLGRDALTGMGGRWGAGAFMWVPDDLDPWEVVAALAEELAAASAGQCGPCARGLPELAAALARSARGRHDATQVGELLDLVDGRGICAHPSASVAALRSALAQVGGAP